jgi:hypothetical protein
LKGLMMASIFFIAFHLPTPMRHTRNRSFVSRSRAKASEPRKTQLHQGDINSFPVPGISRFKGCRLRIRQGAYYRSSNRYDRIEQYEHNAAIVIFGAV